MRDPRPLDSIAVIVPAHRGGPTLDRCLAGIAAQKLGPAEFVVVADGPAAGADVELRAAADRFGARLVIGTAAGGPARARNVGAAATTSPVLFFVDSDVVLAPDACARVASALADPDVDGLFGSYDARPDDPGFTSQYKNLAHHLVHQRADREATTFWGACGVVRRRAFADVGGFDERYRRPCVEDIELGYRLRRAGWRLRVHPELQVTHLKRWTPRGLLRTDLFDRAVPWGRLILTSGTVVDDLGTERRARTQLALTAASAVAALATPALGRRAPVLATGLTAAVLALDRALLSDLARLRGWRFALRALPWRLAHQGICGLGLGLAALGVGAERLGLRPPADPQLRSRAELLDLRSPRTDRATERSAA